MEALGTLKVALTPFLDNIFGHFEKIIVLGAKTTFVNLPALDVQIQPIADGVGMQLPLIKVNLIALNYFKTSLSDVYDCFSTFYLSFLPILWQLFYVLCLTSTSSTSSRWSVEFS